jgi:flavodoxin
VKTLVVYFSRTGHTRRVAEQLAVALGATLCPITEARSREGVFGYLRSLTEAAFGLDGPIGKSTHDPAQFDLVVIGTPIWGWHLSSPVRAFVRRHHAAIRPCAFFCTMGGSGSNAAFAELSKLVGLAPLATLAVTDNDIDRGRAAPKVERFVAALRRQGAAAS